MINIHVRKEDRELVSRASCGLDWMKTVQYIDPNEFPFLGSLLPDADTMFNSRQTVRLRKEISHESVRELLGETATSEIERLCLQVEKGMHLYLWFLGD